MADDKRPFVDMGDYGVFLYNLDVPNRRRSMLYIMGLLFGGVLGGIGYYINGGSTSPASFVFLVISIFVIITLYAIRKFSSIRPINILSPDVMFISAFSLFHFIYIILYVFNITPYDSEIFWSPPKVSLAVFLCICSLVAFLIGYEIAGGHPTDDEYVLRKTPASGNAILVGQFLILVAFLFFWGVAFANFANISRLHQLQGVREHLRFGRFFWVSFDIGLVGLAIYCSNSGLLHHKAMYGRLFPFLAIAYIIGILLVGNRSMFVRMLPAPLLAFHYYQRKMKISWLVGAMVGLLFVSTAIGVTRNIAIFNMAKVQQAYKEQKAQEQFNPFTRALIEFGSTIKVVGIALELVPSEHRYWYGRSYVDSCTNVLPNLTPGKRVFGSGKVNPGYWLSERAFGSLYSTHGRGGSIVMEAYMNFGFVGCICFFLVLGVFLRRIYEKFLARPTLLRSSMLIVITCLLMLWMRNTANVVPRSIIWCFLTAYIVQSFSKLDNYEGMIYNEDSVNVT